jgi:hypothetical protein
MADITIRLLYNLETGKKDIFVDFVSDDDALPIEHEQHHKQVIEQLLGQGILQPDEVGDVNVSRVPPQRGPAQQQQQHTPEKVSSGQ